MTLKDLVEKIQDTGVMLQSNGQDLSNINVKFSVDDRSEGTTIEVDNVDKIIYDLLNQTKITFYLS